MPAEGDVDRIVREAFFVDQSSGVMVEVGAARPDFLSISASYRALGWTVLSIEPNPEFCAAHRSLGHQIFQYACGDTDADDVPFSVVDSLGAGYMDGAVSFESFSSLGIRDEFAELHKAAQYPTQVTTISVKVRKLDTLLAEFAPSVQKLDLLAIDVEGWELEVMRGFSIAKYRPKVIVLENLFKDKRYHDYMGEQNYKLWNSVEPNEIYVADNQL
jgi:FkbM family methyltransferase